MTNEGHDAEQRKTTDGGFTEKLLTVEHEPAAGGGERSILYPPTLTNAELDANWLAVSSDLLVSLDDVQ
ncbi:hypothetical protein NDI54_01750 [Haloarcula sp. S1AR25-5A]|uniref:Uncharacterized protein n=1 Tax=Haloarcula terrestris TaxID=2950533 RepID=A0AAE4JH03_9EURY|nr:hypothetical protein [Haloarcula terrestris]MDS0220069.1 hypothetical protein [Haloarcula terrestris]